MADLNLPANPFETIPPEEENQIKELVDLTVKPGFPFWPWHGHSIHPLRSEQHVLSR